MSTVPEPKHYWASGMRPEQAQKYLNDLCGSESQNYTEFPEEVTCERCLASLRAGRGAPGTRPQEEAANPPPAPVPVAMDPNGVLDREVRAAMLKERDDIIEFIQGLITLDKLGLQACVALRQVAEEIKKRP